MAIRPVFLVLVILTTLSSFNSVSVNRVDVSVLVGILQPCPGDGWGDDRRARLNLDIEIGTGLDASRIRASPFEFNVRTLRKFSPSQD